MEEKQIQTYLKSLVELVDATDDNNAHGIEMLNNKLNEIEHKHGAPELQNILNTLFIRGNDQPRVSILDNASLDSQHVEATKLLLIKGARPFRKVRLSVTTGKMIVAAIQQIKGETFSPTFIEFHVVEQSQQVEAYLKHMRNQVLTSTISSPSINKTFILCWSFHWSCCQMQFSKNSSGVPELQMFFLDASGLKYWNSELSDLYKMAQAIFTADHLKIYRNTLRLQSDSGCKIFSLVFTRMLHSLTFGKFKDVNPSYDLFTDLASKSCEKYQIDGVCITNLTDLPAKFLQLNQRTDELDIKGEHKDRDRTVNSHGKKLGQALDESIKVVEVTKFGRKVHERHNTKLTHKYNAMQATVQQFFSETKSDAEKLAFLNLIGYKFSPAGLPTGSDRVIRLR